MRCRPSPVFHNRGKARARFRKAACRRRRGRFPVHPAFAYFWMDSRRRPGMLSPDLWHVALHPGSMVVARRCHRERRQHLSATRAVDSGQPSSSTSSLAPLMNLCAGQDAFFACWAASRIEKGPAEIKPFLPYSHRARRSGRAPHTQCIACGNPRTPVSSYPPAQSEDPIDTRVRDAGAAEDPGREWPYLPAACKALNAGPPMSIEPGDSRQHVGGSRTVLYLLWKQTLAGK